MPPAGAAEAPVTAGGRDAAVVVTDTGAVRGTVAADHRSFRGIPYAVAARFAPPVPAPAWTGVRPATGSGSACAQPGDPMGNPRSEVEDCLFADVTTPRGHGRHPVLVWLHGGGFRGDSAAHYDGARLAADGVVTVAVNYRLGAFGFLAHPALDGGPGQRLSGAFGIADQQAALRWVRRNIAAFGGDPHRVTLAGQSAGALSVCAHLVAPGSAGLFDRAILQSGPCGLRLPGMTGPYLRPRAEAEQHGLALAARLGCPDPATAAACLRALPVSALLGLSWQEPLSPVVGGLVPVDPEAAIAAGRFARVPVLIGGTRDEHSLFVAALEAGSGRPLTAADYTAQVTAEFGAAAPAVLARYPLARYGSPAVALARVLTDARWSCPTLALARRLARSVPAYLYEFSDRTAPWAVPAGTPSFPPGAFYTAELTYLFPGRGPVLDAGQQALAGRMAAAWTGFARSGVPGPAWRSLRPGGTTGTDLGAAATRTVDLGARHACGFWATLPPG